MENISVQGVVIVALITAFVEVVKNIGVPKKILPIIAVALGVAIGCTYIAPGDIKSGVLIGATLGLTSVGVYSGTKNTIDK